MLSIDQLAEKAQRLHSVVYIGSASISSSNHLSNLTSLVDEGIQATHMLQAFKIGKGLQKKKIIYIGLGNGRRNS